MTSRSALYSGTVSHERLRPRRHRLRYSVFSLLIDLDELETLDRDLRLFGYNRPAAFSFHDTDHGDGTRGGLRRWVEDALVSAGITADGGAIRVLCYPRLFGYVFNPLTLYFCHRQDGRLSAILYEVSNTHGERHTYVIPATDQDGDVIRQTCRKAFFVSPFVSMDCTYRFRILLPGDRTVISINQRDADGPLLGAVFSGRRRSLDDATLAWAFLRYPLMTLKVMGGIHWEALRLWLKGTPVVPYRKAEQAITRSVIPAASG